MKREQLSTQNFYNVLVDSGIDYYCGVPDSITGPLSQVLDMYAAEQHVITANEGNAIGLGIGYHLATGKVPLVYMQNSGLSNAIDPLASLADKEVFSIPMLLLIGWRGQPGSNDEIHHTRQGKITTEILTNLEIPFEVLSRRIDDAKHQINKQLNLARESNHPHAILIEQSTFTQEKQTESLDENSMNREAALVATLSGISFDSIVVSGIGKVSRELYELRGVDPMRLKQDVMVVGGMGHASMVAAGIAKNKPEKKIFCIEGDGSVLMHLGALATIGNLHPKNFYHIVFNNAAHDSVGGLPTTAKDAVLADIAKTCGYNQSLTVDTKKGLEESLFMIQRASGPSLLEIKIRRGARSNLGRPKLQPIDNKKLFMTNLE